MMERVENREKIPDKAVSQSTICFKVHTSVCHVMTLLRAYQCPYRPSPFPTYYPDTGTGSGHSNRTYVGPLAQPLFKHASRRLTLLHTREITVYWGSLLLRLAYRQGEVRRIPLPRTPVNKVERSLGLLLPIDLDEQHPRFEQRRQDREDHARHKPVQTSQPACQHGDARNYRGYRGDLTHRYTQHERPAQIGPQRLPAPQQQQLDSHDPTPGG